MPANRELESRISLRGSPRGTSTQSSALAHRMCRNAPDIKLTALHNTPSVHDYDYVTGNCQLVARKSIITAAPPCSMMLERR